VKENAGYDFSVPSTAASPPRRAGGGRWFQVLILGGVLATLILVWRQGRRVPVDGSGPALASEQQKTLALKLENQGLEAQAVEAWKAYLGITRGAAEDVARIWYRIGTLEEARGAFAAALDAYYRSEQFAHIETLAPEIGRRVQLCLERLGKFAALRRELSERVSLDPAAARAGDEVVAEIGQRKITRTELDRLMEAEIDRQLRAMASLAPAEQINRRKEALLRELGSAQGRMQFLRQYLMSELLYRRAREQKLADDPRIRDAWLAQERAFLAGKVIEREVADRIRISDGDLRTWYGAHKQDYVRPARLRAAHIQVVDEQAAAQVRERLAGGDAFEELVKAFSTDAATREAGGVLPGWIERDRPPAGLPCGPEDLEALFNTDASSVCARTIATARGVHIVKVLERQDAAQQPFESVQTQVYQALRASKERELQTQLLEELQQEYDVVIHGSKLQAAGEGGATPSPGSP
jgi:peptidyl-prolyl cis-trans isomerase C